MGRARAAARARSRHLGEAAANARHPCLALPGSRGSARCRSNVRRLSAPGVISRLSSNRACGTAGGEVNIRIAISKTGAVTSTEALSGERELKAGAEKNIKQWAFSEGEDRSIEMTYVFRLFEPKLTYPHSWNFYDFERATVYVSASRLEPETSSKSGNNTFAAYALPR